MPVNLMKITLIQLPLQGSDFFYSNENIPLAAACLKALTLGQGRDVDLLPQHLMSYGSDQGTLGFLLDVKPDVVGLSCYLWNLERSLFLARKLHRKLPTCTVVLGGPEITPHNEFLLSHGEFDVGVVGPGERVWNTLLLAFPHVPDLPGLLKRGERGQWYFTGINENEPSVRDLPSPYILGCLDSHLDKILWLETVRGCVHQCAYCHYHKQFKKLSPFPLDRIVADVRRAVEKGVEEIAFLDPCCIGGLGGQIDGTAAVGTMAGLPASAPVTIDRPEVSGSVQLRRSGESLFVDLDVALHEDVQIVAAQANSSASLTGRAGSERERQRLTLELPAGASGPVSVRFASHGHTIGDILLGAPAGRH